MYSLCIAIRLAPGLLQNKTPSPGGQTQSVPSITSADAGTFSQHMPTCAATAHIMVVLWFKAEYCTWTCKAGLDAYTVGPRQVSTAASVAMLAEMMLQGTLHVWKHPAHVMCRGAHGMVQRSTWK